MKTKINIISTNYFIEDNVTICTLTCNMQFYKHPACLAIYRCYWKKKYPFVSKWGEFTVTASVKCSKNDKYDYNKGKIIAFSKAKIKMFKLASKIYSEINKHLKEYYFEINETIQACNKQEQFERKHYNEIK